MRDQDKKNLNGRIPASEYNQFEDEAKEKGLTVAEYLRQVVADRHRYQNLLADLQALITASNSELSDAIEIIVRGELRRYRDEIKAQHETMEELKKRLNEQGNVLETVHTKVNNLGAGMAQLLGLKGGNRG